MMRSKAHFLIRILVSVVFLGCIINALGVENFFNSIKIERPVFFLAAILSQFVHLALGAFRWKTVVSALKIDLVYTKVLRIFTESAFINQVMVSSLGGDLYRTWTIKQNGTSLAESVMCTGLDRLLASISIIFVSILAQGIALGAGTSALPPKINMLLGGISLGLIFGFLFLYLSAAILVKWFNPFGIVSVFIEGMQQVSSPKKLLEMLAVSLVVNVNLCLCFYLLALSLHIPLGILDCLILVPPILLISSLPISLAGWGVREGSTIAIFSFVGMLDKHALALAALFGVLSLIGSLPGGLLLLKKIFENKQPLILTR